VTVKFKVPDITQCPIQTVATMTMLFRSWPFFTYTLKGYYQAVIKGEKRELYVKTP